jgi:hypothetical protein
LHFFEAIENPRWEVSQPVVGVIDIDLTRFRIMIGLMTITIGSHFGVVDLVFRSSIRIAILRGILMEFELRFGRNELVVLNAC